MTELRMWAAVFQEEYFEQHPRERYLDREKRRLSDVECNSEQEKLERMMKRAKKPADE